VVVITSCGGLAPSLADRASAVEFVVESPKLTCPPAVTTDVTVTLVQTPVLTGPELPRLAPNGGALASTIVVSPQVLSATEKTVNPVDCELVGKIRKVALVTVPVTPERSKRRKERTTGEPSTRNPVPVP
jgi:hypothetical protein